MSAWDAVTILVFTCHLLAVNLAVGGPLLSVGLAWQADRKHSTWADQAARRLAWQSWWALLLGGALGLVVLGLWWLREPHVYRDGFWHVPRSRLVFGFIEWLFSLLLAWIYAAGWRWFEAHRVWHALLCLVSVTNLAYHFPTLFAAVNELNVDPTLRNTPYDHLALVARPGALAGIVHHLLAGPAVAGSALLAWGAERKQSGTSIDDVRSATTWGARVALVCSLFQVPVGLWYLISLPVTSRDALLGGSLLSACFLGLGIVLAVALLQQWASIAWGETDEALLRRALAMLVLLVLSMVAARHASRERTLNSPQRPRSFVGDMPVRSHRLIPESNPPGERSLVDCRVNDLRGGRPLASTQRSPAFPMATGPTFGRPVNAGPFPARSAPSGHFDAYRLLGLPTTVL